MCVHFKVLKMWISNNIPVEELPLLVSVYMYIMTVLKTALTPVNELVPPSTSPLHLDSHYIFITQSGG